MASGRERFIASCTSAADASPFSHRTRMIASWRSLRSGLDVMRLNYNCRSNVVNKLLDCARRKQEEPLGPSPLVPRLLSRFTCRRRLGLLPLEFARARCAWSAEEQRVEHARAAIVIIRNSRPV